MGECTTTLHTPEIARPPSPLPRKESTFWAKVPKDLSVFYYMYVLTGGWTNKILFLSFFLGHLFLGSNYIR